MPLSLPSLVCLVLALLVLCTASGVRGCELNRLSVLVAAGDEFSVICYAGDSEFVYSWKLGSVADSAHALYQALILNPDSSVKFEKFKAEGYSVDDGTAGRVTLTIANASIVHANNYYCLCAPKSDHPTITNISVVQVVVLVSQPAFAKTTEVTDGQLVGFTCSISFSGSADCSISIECSSENGLCERQFDGKSKGLHIFRFDYHARANSRIYQEYFCSISLTNYVSEATIYSSKKLSVSLHWISVENVQINPVDGTQCFVGRQCAINQTVHCTAKSNPRPITFQWLISINGSGYTVSEIKDDLLTFKTAGDYAVQCIAFNQIIGTWYNSSSSLFKTQVTPATEEPDTSLDKEPKPADNNTSLIVGLVVGIGGALIIVGAIFMYLIWKRNKLN